MDVDNTSSDSLYFSYSSDDALALFTVWSITSLVTIGIGAVVTTQIVINKKLHTPSNMIVASLYISDVFSIISRVLAPLAFTIDYFNLESSARRNLTTGHHHHDPVAVTGMGAVYIFSSYTTVIHMLLAGIYTSILYTCSERACSKWFSLFKTTVYLFTGWYTAFLLNVPLFADNVLYIYVPGMMVWWYSDITNHHHWYKVVHTSVIVGIITITTILYVVIIIKRSAKYHRYFASHRVAPETTLSTTPPPPLASEASSSSRQSEPSTSNGVAAPPEVVDNYKTRMHKAYFKQVISTIDDTDVLAGSKKIEVISNNNEAPSRVSGDGRSRSASRAWDHNKDESSEVFKQYLGIFLVYSCIWLLEQLCDTVIKVNNKSVRNTSPQAAKVINALINTLWLLSYLAHFVLVIYYHSVIRQHLIFSIREWHSRWRRCMERYRKRPGGTDDAEMQQHTSPAPTSAAQPRNDEHYEQQQMEKYTTSSDNQDADSDSDTVDDDNQGLVVRQNGALRY